MTEKSDKQAPIKLGISIGDLNGIGGEIIIKAFEDPRMLELCLPVIFASTKLLSGIKKHFQAALDFHGIEKPSVAIAGKVNVVQLWKEPIELHYGKETKESGAYAVRSLRAATEALKNGDIDILVTAPINKHNVYSEDFPYAGHTDYLAAELEGQSLMLMVADKLRVGLLTDHIPVSEVSKAITPSVIRAKALAMDKCLKEDFGISKAKIAVLSINPHSGDQGVIGKEDDLVLKPTLERLRDQGMLIYGPYAADSFFGGRKYEAFDGILASYHDQGLIPFKTIAFGRGVNYTAGLTKIRTSPDHGTAFDIAGKGLADPTSFLEAIFLGMDIFRKRREYGLWNSNKLKKQKLPQREMSDD